MLMRCQDQQWELNVPHGEVAHTQSRTVTSEILRKISHLPRFVEQGTKVSHF